MAFFSYDKLRQTRGIQAKEVQERTQGTPENDTPDALLDAADRARTYETAARLPSEMATAEILENHKELFEGFLKKETELALSGDLKSGDLEKIAEARVEFLSRVAHAEQVRDMVTPELLNQLVISGFDDPNLGFKKLVDSVSPGVFLDIIRKQMVPLAVNNPERFQSLARSIERAALTESDEEHRGRKEKAAKILDKYNVHEKDAVGLSEILNDPDLTEEEKQEKLQDVVRRSKSVFGLAQKGIEMKAESMRAPLETLRLKHKEGAVAFEAYLDELNELEGTRIPELRRNADARNAAEGFEVDMDLVEAQIRAKELREILSTTERRQNKLAGRIKFTERVLKAFDGMSSKGGAERLADSLKDAQEVIKDIDAHMNEISGALRTVTDQDPKIRAEMLKALKGERDAADAVTLRNEKSPAGFLPQGAAYQRDFDRFVAGQRLEGAEETREKLVGLHRKDVSRRANEAYRDKNPKAGFLNMLFTLFGSDAPRATKSRTVK